MKTSHHWKHIYSRKHKSYCFVLPYSGVKYLFYVHPFLDGYENGGYVVEPEREWSTMVKAKTKEICLQRARKQKGDIDSDNMQ